MSKIQDDISRRSKKQLEREVHALLSAHMKITTSRQLSSTVELFDRATVDAIVRAELQAAAERTNAFQEQWDPIQNLLKDFDHLTGLIDYSVMLNLARALDGIGLKKAVQELSSRLAALHNKIMNKLRELPKPIQEFEQMKAVIEALERQKNAYEAAIQDASEGNLQALIALSQVHGEGLSALGNKLKAELNRSENRNRGKDPARLIIGQRLIDLQEKNKRPNGNPYPASRFVARMISDLQKSGDSVDKQAVEMLEYWQGQSQDILRKRLSECKIDAKAQPKNLIVLS